MKIFDRSIVIASFALVGALPAAAQSPTAAPADRPSQTVSVGASAADRDSYVQQAQGKVRQWRGKLDEFGLKAEKDGKEARKAASADLNKDWNRVKDASAGLKTASAAEWEGAKAAFEKASGELSAAWDKAVAKAR